VAGTQGHYGYASFTPCGGPLSANSNIQVLLYMFTASTHMHNGLLVHTLPLAGVPHYLHDTCHVLLHHEHSRGQVK